ncbi:MAG: twin-arginine translocation signal domain-containing protein, partial [Actinomycetota bacterium]
MAVTTRRSPMDRREFLKRASVTPVALASLPLLSGGIAEASEDGHKFRFVALSRGATTPDGVQHVIAMNGNGRILEDDVRGRGSFVHFDNAPTAPIPKPIIFTGIWGAGRLLSFTTIGSWGRFLAGILEMTVKLVPDGGSPVKGTMTVVCNLAPAGLLTG